MTNADDLNLEYLEKLRKEYLRNQAELDRLTDMQNGIKQRMLDAIQAGKDIPEGVTPRAAVGRIDNAKLANAYPVGQFPHLYKPAIDNAAIKEHIAPAELEQYKKYGEATVVIKG